LGAKAATGILGFKNLGVKSKSSGFSAFFSLISESGFSKSLRVLSGRKLKPRVSDGKFDAKESHLEADVNLWL
jgi:hypothetical protein